MFVFGNHVYIVYADSWLGTKSAQMFMKCVKSAEESQLLKAALSDLEAGEDSFKNNSSKNRERGLSLPQVEGNY